MARWVKVCDVAAAPAKDAVAECEADGVAVCLANVGGKLSAMSNWCPHRGAPLGQGWIEGTAVICPWHSWAFDAESGVADYPEGERVAVFPVQVQGGDVMIEID